jgi:hypothetical protein
MGTYPASDLVVGSAQSALHVERFCVVMFCWCVVRCLSTVPAQGQRRLAYDALAVLSNVVIKWFTWLCTERFCPCLRAAFRVYAVRNLAS